MRCRTEIIKRIRKKMGCQAALTALVVALLSAPLAASNMGVKHIFKFPLPGQTLHWISVPVQYDGADAEALCADLSGVGSVWRWDEVSSTLAGHTCGDPSPFALVAGEGYLIVNAAGEDIDGVLVGSHVDGFTYSFPAASTSNLNWTSIPYHLRLASRFDAENLCASVGEGELFAVVAWDEELGAYTAHACGSEFAAPFVLDRSRAYALVNEQGQTIDWQAPVWLENE